MDDGNFYDSSDDGFGIDNADLQDSSSSVTDFDSSEFEQGFLGDLKSDEYSYEEYSRNFDAYEQDPRIQFIEELSTEFGLNSNQFMEQFHEQRTEDAFQEQLQAEFDYLVNAGVSPDVAENLIAERLQHEEMVAQHNSYQQNQPKNEDIAQFLHDFREYEGQDWDSSVQLPVEIVLACENYGMTLSDAYQSYIKVNHGNGIIRDELLIGFNSI
jgi:hypothetical protein